MLALSVILLIVAFFMVAVSIMMSGDSVNNIGSLVGSSDLDLFKHSKDRGSKKWFNLIMLFLGLILIALSIVIKIYL